MRILLPPSEAKQTGGRSSTTAETSPLSAQRSQVAAALIEFCSVAPAAAAEALALPTRSREADLHANRTIVSQPTRPALDRYAGTVYDGLDAASLTPAGRRRALESVLIFSGLFGVLRADELIPAYRLPVAATLPGVGALSAFWREPLRTHLPELVGDELIVDLRSSDYSAMWRPTGPLRDQVVSVRLVCAQPDGRLSVISYPSKYGKGRLTRALVSARGRVKSAGDVARTWTDAGGVDAIVRSATQVDLVTPNITVVRPSVRA